MRVPDDLLTCVVYIGQYVADKRGVQVEQYAGTAFYVGIESVRIPGVMFTYLVTAAHVAEAVEGNFWVRQNSEDGSARPVHPVNHEWIYHPGGKAVDVAIMPWPLPDEMAHLAIPPEMMLTTPDDFTEGGIGVGDEVFTMGVFPYIHGVKRNTPLVRKGNLAMLPIDKIRTKKGPMDGYLVEAHSLGGMSGAPVFVRETVSVHSRLRRGTAPDAKVVERSLQSAGRHFLLGLMHGHWDIGADDVDAPYWHSPQTGEAAFHLGLSVVVPASKILEALNHPDLKQRRTDSEDAHVATQPMPTQDSVTREVAAQPQKRGPEPERLVIEGDWEDAAKRAMQKRGKPER